MRKIDVKPLPLAYAIPQFVRLLPLHSGQSGLADVRVRRAENGVSHRKIRVQADGVLQHGNRAGKIIRGHHLSGQTERLKRLEGRRRGLLGRRVEFLNRAQGFAEFAANFGGGLAQRV